VVTIHVAQTQRLVKARLSTVPQQ
jgi:hypothetical protein